MRSSCLHIFWRNLNSNRLCFVLRARRNRYYCKRCTDANQTKDKEERTTVTFSPWDADVLARMDDFVFLEFPFVLTKKAAICKSLVHRLSDDLLEGKGFAATSKSLEKAYSATYLKNYRSYVSLMNSRKAQLKGLFGKDPDVGQISMFGCIEDPAGFNSNHPSAHYLRDIWNKWFYETPVVQVWILFDGCTYSRRPYLSAFDKFAARSRDGTLLLSVH